MIIASMNALVGKVIQEWDQLSDKFLSAAGARSKMKEVLDFAYITPKIIALGDVADSHLNELVQMTNRDPVVIWNLGGVPLSKLYTSTFDSQIINFPLKSSYLLTKAPLLHECFSLCQSIKSWYDLNDKNLAIVQCPDGLPSTGILIACLLKYIGAFEHTTTAYDFYCSKRLVKEDTSIMLAPSYQTLFDNIDKTVDNNGYANTKPLHLKTLAIGGLPVDEIPSVEIYDMNGLVFASHAGLKHTSMCTWNEDFGDGFFKISQDILGDFALICRFGGHLATNKDKSTLIFKYQNATAFLEGELLELQHYHIDVNPLYADSIETDDFKIRMIFEMNASVLKSIRSQQDLTAIANKNYHELPDFITDGRNAFEIGLDKISRSHPVEPNVAKCGELKSKVDEESSKYISVALQLANNSVDYGSKLVAQMKHRCQYLMSLDCGSGNEPASAALTASEDVSRSSPSIDIVSDVSSEDSWWEVACPVCRDDSACKVDQMIPCSLCNRSFHTWCVGIRKIPYNAVTERLKREKYIQTHFIDWRCLHCAQISQERAESSSDIKIQSTDKGVGTTATPDHLHNIRNHPQTHSLSSSKHDQIALLIGCLSENKLSVEDLMQMSAEMQRGTIKSVLRRKLFSPNPKTLNSFQYAKQFDLVTAMKGICANIASVAECVKNHAGIIDTVIVDTGHNGEGDAATFDARENMMNLIKKKTASKGMGAVDATNSQPFLQSGSLEHGFTNSDRGLDRADRAGGSGSGKADDGGLDMIKVKELPEFVKYFKMMKVGIAKNAVAERLFADGLVDSQQLAFALLGLDPDLPLPENFLKKPPPEEKKEEKKEEKDEDKKVPVSDNIINKQKVNIINMKRAQKAGIALARILFKYEDMREKIMNMDDEGLTTDQLKSLEEFLPTPEEIGLIKAYKGDILLLGQAEKYMLVMLDFEEAPKRIKCMIYKQQFKSRALECRRKLAKIENTCDDIKLSSRLKKVLKTILKVVNQLNDGEEHKGFTLDSLLKLQSTKAYDKKTSILQYVIMLIYRNDPDCLRLNEDLKNLSEASRLTFESVAGEKNALKEEFDANFKIVMDIAKNDPDCKTGSMIDFLQKADEQNRDLQKSLENVKSKFSRVLHYFGEDPQMTSVDFFSKLDRFVLEFVTARDAVELLRRRESKKAEKIASKRLDRFLTSSKHGKKDSESVISMPVVLCPPSSGSVPESHILKSLNEKLKLASVERELDEAIKRMVLNLSDLNELKLRLSANDTLADELCIAEEIATLVNEKLRVAKEVRLRLEEENRRSEEQKMEQEEILVKAQRAHKAEIGKMQEQLEQAENKIVLLEERVEVIATELTQMEQARVVEQQKLSEEKFRLMECMNTLVEEKNRLAMEKLTLLNEIERISASKSEELKQAKERLSFLEEKCLFAEKQKQFTAEQVQFLEEKARRVDDITAEENRLACERSRLLDEKSRFVVEKTLIVESMIRLAEDSQKSENVRLSEENVRLASEASRLTDFAKFVAELKKSDFMTETVDSHKSSAEESKLVDELTRVANGFNLLNVALSPTNLQSIVTNAIENSGVLGRIDTLLKTSITDIHKLPTMAILVPETSWSAKFTFTTYKCRLFFVCSHTLQVVPCGPKGKGYVLHLKREWFVKAAPVFKVCVIVLKIALAVSGIPIPMNGAMESLDKAMGAESAAQYLSMMQDILDFAESSSSEPDDSMSSVCGDANVFAKQLDALIKQAGTLQAYKLLEQVLLKLDPTCADIGVTLIMCPKSGAVGWVKDDPDVKADFLKSEGVRCPLDVKKLKEIYDLVVARE